MEKEIIEGNVLIELFMYPKYTRQLNWILWNDEHGSRHRVETINYSHNWDNLMKVVEKIRGLHPEEDDMEIAGCKINHLTIWADIKTVYKEVVLFITWYNTLNSLTK